MEKERLFVFLSNLNENYQSFKFARIDNQEKLNDFICILEDKFTSLGGVKYNLISSEDESLLRSINYVYNGTILKQTLFKKYFEDFEIFFNINPILGEQLQSKILILREYEKNKTNTAQDLNELGNICSLLNKIAFRFKLPSSNINILKLIDNLYIYIYKSELINVDVIKKIILDLKTIRYLMDIEIEILSNSKSFFTRNIPINIKDAFTSSNNILYSVLIDEDFGFLTTKTLKLIYDQFIPPERLEFLENNPKNIIIYPSESEVKNLEKIEQQIFVVNRLIDFCFGIRMIYLKDYVFNSDKSSLDNYYILIQSSFNRIKLVLLDNGRA